MKLVLPICFAGALGVLSFLTLIPLASADETTDFKAFLKRFYFIDDLGTEVRCTIDSPALNDLVERLAATPSNILKIRQNIDEFEIVLKKDTPLRIIEPKLTLEVVSYEEVADRKTFDAGLKNVADGFTMTVSGIRTMVGGIFAELIRPTSKELSNAKLEKNADTFEASLSKNGVTAVHTYSGGKRLSKVSGGDYDKEIVTEYTKIQGKDAISTISTLSRNPQTGDVVSKENIDVKYNETDGVMLPAKLLSSATLGPPGALAVSTEINFSNCRVSR